MSSILLISQLLLCLVAGYVISPFLALGVKQFLLKCLGYFCYVLLACIAFEFSHYTQALAAWHALLKTALLLATSTTFASFFCCWLMFKWLNTPTASTPIDLKLLLHSIFNISKSILALACGVLLYHYTPLQNWHTFINSWYLLLLFMLLIGIDCRHMPISKSWLNIKIVLLPLTAILGSGLAALLCFFCLKDFSLMQILALSQGHGFYSMSGIVMTKLGSTELGQIALMTDLLRELFAILLLYAIGWRYPRASIAAAGATAMDATLPMIKQSCGNQFIPHAMISGLVLSILAPILVSLLAVI